MNIKTMICTSLFAYFSCIVHAQADDRIEVFHPKFPKFSSTQAQRQQENQFYLLGNASFQNQVSVPIYGVTALSPVDDEGVLLKDFEKCNANSCHYNFKLDATDAKSLKILALPSLGAILVPRTWTDVQANTGANGSGSAILMSPDGHEAITLYNSALCAGCGMPNASLYFPQLLQRSLNYDYGGMKDPQKKLALVYPSKNVAFFSYQIPQRPSKTHGVAKYNQEDGFNFQDIHINLNEKNQPFARPMLNFYNSTH